MEHFDTVLPGRVHRVYYEQLIADPETEVRRLLDHCGLQFEAQCLRFYENPPRRADDQLRAGAPAAVYRRLDQWRHYEPGSGP